MSEWDELEPVAPGAAEPAACAVKDMFGHVTHIDVAGERADRLADLAEKLFYIDRENAELKEARKRAILDLEGLIPETHEGEIKAHGWTIMVERGERWSWDKDILEQLLKAKGINDPENVPPFISRSTTINRKKFDVQPDAERAEWMPALTRQKGTTKITVTPDDKYKYEEL